jgi:hypothetical protein
MQSRLQDRAAAGSYEFSLVHSPHTLPLLSASFILICCRTMIVRSLETECSSALWSHPHRVQTESRLCTQCYCCPSALRALTRARCVLSPTLDPFIKTLCSHQCSILSPKLCALTNARSSHQDSVLSPTMRALTKTLCSHQCCVLSPRSSHQDSVLSPMLRAITKTMCSHQCCVLSPTMCALTNDASGSNSTRSSISSGARFRCVLPR